MRGGAESSTIETWKAIAVTEPQSRWRSDYAALALVFADLAECQPPWRDALEDWNMRESQQVLEWQEEARVGMKRDDLLRLVQLRFPVPLPEDLVSAVRGEPDLAILARWFDIAATASSLDDLQARLFA